MKRIFTIALVLLLSVSFFAVANGGQEEEAKEQ